MATNSLPPLHDVEFTHDGTQWTYELIHNLEGDRVVDSEAAHATAKQIIATDGLLDQLHATSARHSSKQGSSQILTPLGNGMGYMEYSAFSDTPRDLPEGNGSKRIAAEISTTPEGLAQARIFHGTNLTEYQRGFNAREEQIARAAKKLGKGEYLLLAFEGEGEQKALTVHKGRHTNTDAKLEKIDLSKTGKSRTGLYVGIAAAALAVVGGALYFMHRRKQQQEAKKTAENSGSAVIAGQSQATLAAQGMEH